MYLLVVWLYNLRLKLYEFVLVNIIFGIVIIIGIVFGGIFVILFIFMF